ncbi:MAG: L-histidine N(alpha)-methyltransferase [Pseudonocardiales bacterium]|nr:L-histidine N(alpha)-methyltransferase [Pseudonocardiales bacterium]
MTASHTVLDVHLTDADAEAALRWDAWVGLTARPKQLPPKWFYDARGSELFEQITELPEYYPTRTERALLHEHAPEIAAVAAAAGVDTLVELGSGSSEKTRLLLDALSAAGTCRRYVPQDVSESALRGAVDALLDDYPDLAVHGVVGDFTRHLGLLPAEGRRLVAFLGGTIGNLQPAERAAFLVVARAAMRPGEYLLLGAGLVTDPAVLVAAYDDAAGVTAEFNRNVLAVLNRQLGAEFDLDDFDHVAHWDADNEWIEMRLRARRLMTVRVRELELEVPFAAGEEMRTEISAKFRPEGLRAEVTAAGFEPVRFWTDPDDRFALSLWKAA